MDRQHLHPSVSRSKRTLVLGTTVFAITLSACSSNGPASNLRTGGSAPAIIDRAPAGSAAVDPAPVDPAPVDPAPVDPAPVDPAPVDPQPVVSPPTLEPAPVVQDPTTPDDSTDWLPIVLIIGGIIVAIALLASVFGRSKRRSPLPENPRANLLSTSQWIHDQLSLELLAAPPTAALQRWSTERSRLDDVAIGSQQQFSEGNDANWQTLAQTMSALASVLDTALHLRAQDPPNAQLINESTAVVNRQRGVLAQLIAALRPTVDR